MADGVKLTCAACGQMNRIPADKLSAGPKCGVCGAALADGHVMELDAAAHDKAVRGDGLPLIVDYWAAWCGPCRAMAPEFAKAAKAAAPQVRFGKLDTEANPSISARARSQGIPALILYKGGREAGRLTGARPAGQILDFLRQQGVLTS